MAEASPNRRPSLGSILFLAAFFFFMSGNNNSPVETSSAVNELQWNRKIRDEWQAWIHNTTTNYTEPPPPVIAPEELLPPTYNHPTHLAFYHNLTGFHRHSKVHPLNLTTHDNASPFFSNVSTPVLNSTNATLIGQWDWARTYRADFNIKERPVSEISTLQDFSNWSWVKGSVILFSPSISIFAQNSLTYDFYGLHHIPTGIYNIYGLPTGMRVDIRRLPSLWHSHSEEIQNQTKEIVLRELQHQVKVQEANFMVADHQPDETNDQTSCSLLIHLALPPLPLSVNQHALDDYIFETEHPTGILASLPVPPQYWQVGKGMGGLLLADECGWALGVEGGRGMSVTEFWSKSNYYTFVSTLSSLVLLLLLVYQMESTRTPSTLSKVSLYTILIMSISDSYVFSLNVVLGIVQGSSSAGQERGLGFFVVGFLAFCGAVVFGPRYVILLHRIQAPERSSSIQPFSTQSPNYTETSINNAQSSTFSTATVTATENNQQTSTGARIRRALSDAGSSLNIALRAAPALKWLLITLLIFSVLPLLFTPPLLPFVFIILYSFWIPQIWRNARRGHSRALDWGFILDAFAYTDNVFFIDEKPWIWGLVFWQIIQVGWMWLQEIWSPAFFLPKSLSPPEQYNYHPSLPFPDPENPLSYSASETTCSICFETVDVYAPHHYPLPSPSTLDRHRKTSEDMERLLGGVSVGVGTVAGRKIHAIAPCGHVFHTHCLAQWMSVKTICPLCKRSLPPM
nr:hypothetical protein L204_06299 [Cryptococcus depauperatus CBS 7855]